MPKSNIRPKTGSKSPIQEQRKYLKTLCGVIIIDIVITVFLLICMSIKPSGQSSSTENNLANLGILFLMPLLHIPMIPVGAATVNKATDLKSDYAMVLGYIAAFLIPITLLLSALISIVF